MCYKSVRGWCCPEKCFSTPLPYERQEKNHKKSRNQDAKFEIVKYYKIETDRTCTEMVLLIETLL